MEKNVIQAVAKKIREELKEELKNRIIESAIDRALERFEKMTKDEAPSNDVENSSQLNVLQLYCQPCNEHFGRTELTTLVNHCKLVHEGPAKHVFICPFGCKHDVFTWQEYLKHNMVNHPEANVNLRQEMLKCLKPFLILEK